MHHSMRSVFFGRSFNTCCRSNQWKCTEDIIYRLTWSLRRRRTNGVIIVFARLTRSSANNCLESPFTLKMARRLFWVSSSPNLSGRMKFMTDCEGGYQSNPSGMIRYDTLTTSSWRLFCNGVPVRSNFHSESIFIKLV